MQVEWEDHYTTDVAYAPGRYTYTKPTWAPRQGGSYLRHRGGDANIVQTAARGPIRTSAAILQARFSRKAKSSLLPFSTSIAAERIFVRPAALVRSQAQPPASSIS